MFSHAKYWIIDILAELFEAKSLTKNNYYLKRTKTDYDDKRSFSNRKICIARKINQRLHKIKNLLYSKKKYIFNSKIFTYK